MALTLEERHAKKQRENLQMIHNTVMTAWAFKQLKVWYDFYKKLGYDDTTIRSNHTEAELQTPIDFGALKAVLQKQKDDLELKLKPQTPGVGLHAQLEPVVAKVEPPVTQPVQQVLISPTSNTGDESGLTNDNDYGLHISPNESAFHFWFQKKAIKEMYDKIVVEKKTGILLLAGTGTGKTFMVAGTLRRLMDINYQDGKTISHMPYLFVTKTTVVEQCGRVFKKFYNMEPDVDVEVINIEQLRSKSGKFWLKEEVKIINGEEESIWKWKKLVQPCVVFFDESQGAKNSGSTQSKIMYAYNDLLENSCLVNVSATPFTRVSEAQCFAVSTHRPLEHLGFPPGTRLTNDNWSTYAAMIAAPNKPDEYNEAAIERLMKDLEPWVVRVKNVRSQFDAENGIERISFETKEERVFYEQAWERFLKEKAKKDAELALGVAEGNYMFTILLKFSMAAELCRAEHLAKKMYEAVKRGKAAVCCVKFKGTIIKASMILNEKYGVPRDKMSMVWGGGQTQLNAKQKAKAKIKALGDKLAAAGLGMDEMLEDLNLDDVDDREILNLPEHMRLGSQSMDERQIEIDKFQSGRSLYCFYTFRAGGVGLSLHHTDEFCDTKVRRKKSGYAVEEDIVNVPVRPREVFVAPTYSAIELVQGLGRCPRLTSLSNTKQTLLFYRGTIEDDIADIVSAKLRCLSKVVKQHEKWQDCIIGGGVSKQEHINSTKDLPDDAKGEMLSDNEEEE